MAKESEPEVRDERDRSPEDFAVPISAIEHYSYCPRQCALIHVEQTYDENQFTIRGSMAHERTDRGEESVADGIKTVRSIPLWSDRLGLRGRADLVEFRPGGPYPVEYKLGKRRANHADYQLCAQALCLEEMLNVTILRGATFHYAEQRRYEIELDDELRQQTVEMIQKVRQIMVEQLVPEAANDARCPNCSLINACLPSVLANPNRLRGLQGALFRPISGVDDDSWDESGR
jgi:CRISPR-associated exonuclease Cas4